MFYIFFHVVTMVLLQKVSKNLAFYPHRSPLYFEWKRLFRCDINCCNEKIKGIDAVWMIKQLVLFIFCNVECARILNSIAKKHDYHGNDHINFFVISMADIKDKTLAVVKIKLDWGAYCQSGFWEWCSGWYVQSGFCKSCLGCMWIVSKKV